MRGSPRRAGGDCVRRVVAAPGPDEAVSSSIDLIASKRARSKWMARSWSMRYPAKGRDAVHIAEHVRTRQASCGRSPASPGYLLLIPQPTSSNAVPRSGNLQESMQIGFTPGIDGERWAEPDCALSPRPGSAAALKSALDHEVAQLRTGLAGFLSSPARTRTSTESAHITGARDPPRRDFIRFIAVRRFAPRCRQPCSSGSKLASLRHRDGITAPVVPLRQAARVIISARAVVAPSGIRAGVPLPP